LIDEACARASIVQLDDTSNQQYKLINEQIIAIDVQIETAVADQDYFKAAELKKQQNELKIKIQELK
jgi:ATP-dependent Clp protease ATP-binding subunit ClpA